MNTLPRPQPLVIAILDGWGVSNRREGNAARAADTPTMDILARHYPTASISAAGLEVGLPLGEPGDSETGHRNIGAGRVEYQIQASINQAIEDKSFFKNEVLLAAIKHARKHKSSLHLMGLVSRGGVHSQLNHLVALLKMTVQQKLKEKVYIHMFTDGRDTLPKSALVYLNSLQEAIDKIGTGEVVSVTGRWYAMDRNLNWERTMAVYYMLTGGERPPGATSPEQAVAQAYKQGVSDSRIPPTAVTKGGGPLQIITDDDAVIFFNFRPDRARQLTEVFVAPKGLAVPVKKLKNLYFATLAQYDPALPAPAAYKEAKGELPLAKIISDGGLRQLHIAETEKYAHVTYYLNVGWEQPFKGEKREIVRSSKVRDFAKEPEMKAKQLTDYLAKAIARSLYDVYFVNYSNADMVAHTGDFEAAGQACSFVDKCMARLVDATLKAEGALIVTADHGNVEEMIDPKDKSMLTEHSTNPVPFYYVRNELKRRTAKSDREVGDIFSEPIGVLADVAPTVLDVMRIDKPETMTGVSLLGSLR